ncbi:MAG: GntR family transcriptional regulator [Acidimicrobiales bacterium]
MAVDVFDPTPPYEQIRRQIVALVSSGALGPGDRLPTVRQLANDLGLAAGTVARAYRELEGTGWLRTRRGAGTRVGATPPRTAADPAAVRQLADEFVRRARFLGADDATILRRVTDALS